MNNSTLKILAIIFMTIDHIGYMISSPIATPMRMIGRLSFPIFLFLIIEGYKRTSNIAKYILNLYVFAFVSMFPFYYAFNMYWNVFFTLGTVVLMLYLFENTENNIFNFIIFIIFFLIAKPFDWGQPAILTVYLLKNKLDDTYKLGIYIPLVLSFSTWLYYVTDFSFYTLQNIHDVSYYINQAINTTYVVSLYLVSILFAIPFLTSYNGERGLRLRGYKKYLFYIYYPLHLIVIATIFR